MSCLLFCLFLGQQYERRYDLVMMKQVINYTVAFGVVFLLLLLLLFGLLLFFLHSFVASAAAVGMRREAWWLSSHLRLRILMIMVMILLLLLLLTLLVFLSLNVVFFRFMKTKIFTKTTKATRSPPEARSPTPFPQAYLSYFFAFYQNNETLSKRTSL